MNSDTRGQDSGAQCPFSVVDVRDYAEIGQVLRSTSVIQNPDATAGNLARTDPIAELNAREFFDGIIDQVNGPDHRRRRKLLNSLVRPENLDRIREEIVLPALERSMVETLQPREDSTYGCDLAELMDRTFLEFSARLIGLRGIDTQEGIEALRRCVHPLHAAAGSRYYEDSEGAMAAGLQAKSDFTELFYKPSLAAFEETMREVERGERSLDDIPDCLLKFIVTGAEPAYEDEDIATREAVMLFMAAASTSTQSILSTVNELFPWFENHPADAGLKSDEEFLGAALQEAMRLKAPFNEFSVRQAAEDVTIGNTMVRKGDEIHVHFPRADRDRERFGSDADHFNPRREVAVGTPRYGLSFAAGPHQCFGLRIVLGNDGHGGSHVHTLLRLFEAGIEPDPANPATTLPMTVSDVELQDLTNFVSYPVIFTNWKPVSASTD